MMTEISLNILDIAENSVKAKASLIEISIDADFSSNILSVIIKDNGCGTTKEQVTNVTDPFYTTRTTRKVGLGVPFYKAAAESTGGSFSITSSEGVGTAVIANFVLDNIDRMPMGDICATIHTLIVMHSEIDFLFNYKVNDNSFVLDTKEFRKIWGDIPFNSPEVSSYIKEYLRENISFVNGKIII